LIQPLLHPSPARYAERYPVVADDFSLTINHDGHS
jgi:hypothetical protein